MESNNLAPNRQDTRGDDNKSSQAVKYPNGASNNDDPFGSGHNAGNHVGRIREILSEDPFAPENYLIDQEAQPAAKQLLTKIPIRRPKKHEFFRVSETLYVPGVAIYELDGDRDDIYLIHPRILPHMEDVSKKVELFLTANRQGTYAFWPVGLADQDGKRNGWHISAADAAHRAKTAWIRIVSNRDLGGYDVFEAEGAISEPTWPAESLRDLLEIAFRGKVINSVDHDVLKRLRGQL